MRREDTAFKDTPKKSFLVSGRVLNNFLNFLGGVTLKLNKEQIKTDGILCLKRLFKSIWLASFQIFGKNDQDYMRK